MPNYQFPPKGPLCTQADLLQCVRDNLAAAQAKYQALDLGNSNAAVLATVGANAYPEARIILIKDVTEEGLCFFTNLNSPKAQAIARDPKVSLLMHWELLKTQIRIQGVAQQVSAEESDAYFKTRSRDSQIGAWVSQQSSPLTRRADLLEAVEEKSRHFEGQEVPRPDFWGGYVVKPNYFEFWYDGDTRLHERYSYTAEFGLEGVFRLQLLYP